MFLLTRISWKNPESFHLLSSWMTLKQPNLNKSKNMFQYHLWYISIGPSYLLFTLLTSFHVVAFAVVSAIHTNLYISLTELRQESKQLQVSFTWPWNYLNFVHCAAHTTHTDTNTSSCSQPRLNTHFPISVFLCVWEVDEDCVSSLLFYMFFTLCVGLQSC